MYVSSGPASSEHLSQHNKLCACGTGCCDVVVPVCVFTGSVSSFRSWPFKIEISVTSVIEGFHNVIMLGCLTGRSVAILSPAAICSVNFYSNHRCCLSLPRQNLNVDESLLCVIHPQGVIVGVQQRPGVCLRMFQDGAGRNHFVEFK